jgi:hypothetical protein
VTAPVYRSAFEFRFGSHDASYAAILVLPCFERFEPCERYRKANKAESKIAALLSAFG